MDLASASASASTSTSTSTSGAATAARAPSGRHQWYLAIFSSFVKSGTCIFFSSNA